MCEGGSGLLGGLVGVEWGRRLAREPWLFARDSSLVNRIADMWLVKICLIFVGRGGNFEYLRYLHHVEIL